jgi:hypothetical protein
MSEPAADTLVSIARQLLLALEPLRRGFADEEEFTRLLYSLGWNVTGVPNAYVQASGEIEAGLSAVERMVEPPFQLSEVGELLGHAVKVYDTLDPLPAVPPGMDPGASLDEVGKYLSDLLICEYLARAWPQVYTLLEAMEVIVTEHLGDTPTQHGYARSVFRWDEIPNLLDDPHLILQRVYGWGTDALDMGMICHHLANFFDAVGFAVRIIQPGDGIIGAYADRPFALFGRAEGLKWPFYYTSIADTPIELSFQLLPLPATETLKPGLIIQPGIPSTVPLQLELSPETTLEITAGSDIAQQFGILIRPEGLSVKYPFMDASAIPTVTFGLAVRSDPAEPQIIFGTSGGVRLQMKGFRSAIQATGRVDDIELTLSFDLKELSLVLAADEGDGFLRKLLGEGETTVAIPLGIDWSSHHGFGFRGSMNLEVSLHPHLKLGPIEIPDVKLSLGVPADPQPKVRIEAGLTLIGDLGPLKVAVEEVGFGLYARFTPGNAGPIDLSVGFKPPKGVGLSIDAGAVRGGGYLRFDPEREEYSGNLQLTILDTISITATGMITTQMPDGSKSFSLLVIISVEFNPGIQLGMGFTLSGLGGLLGLNRTVVLEALMLGVRTGTVDSIMFPTGDIIANAPRILSDLRTIFPPYPGKFLIGPMAKIAWGTPTLVSLSVGVIIEIPGNIAIVGVLRLILPTPDEAILVLQVVFAGAIEFDKQRLFFFAVVFESRLLFITIEGEVGLLLRWGADPVFVFTVGGFHPRFTPPALPFPSPARLALCILNEPKAMVRVDTYIAVTSNTVQIGARAELRFGFDSFGISGHFGFDALFRFSPFYFVIDVKASLSLKVAGMSLLSVRVELSLEGPTPWHAHGTGRVSFFFFSISANFDVTWGESADTTLPPIAIVPLLKTELDKRENWTTTLPASIALLVSLRSVDDAADAVVLHPLGALRISQRLLPLGLTLDKLGTQKPSDARRFELLVEEGSIKKKGEARESFAMAQFQDMDDAEKLTRASFEPGNGGLELGVDGASLATDHMARRIVRYEEVLIDTEYKRHQRFRRPAAGLFGHHLKGSAVTQSPLSAFRRSQLDPFGVDKVKVVGETFAVVSVDTNQPHSEAASSFGSEAEARQYLATLTARDRSIAASLHVIPASEAA